MKTTFNSSEEHVRLNQRRPPQQQRRASSAGTPASAYTNTDDLPSTNRRSDINAEGLRRSSVPHLGVNGLRSSVQTGSKNIANVVLNRRTSWAPASTAPASTRSSQASTRASIQEFLPTLRLPSGILSSVLECANSCNSTLWLLDSSSSMKVCDGRVVCSDGMTSIDEVSRWHELRDCIAFHSYMASKCWIRSHFWLLNDDDRSTTRKFHLCCGSPNDVANEISCLNAALKQSKLSNDQCPLTDQLHELVKKISNGAHTLVSNGETVTVVICTQGVPTNEEGGTSRDIQRSFWSAMKKLSKLPVKIVVRLCTGDESVCDVYNMMDARVENMDVLGDYWGEAMQIQLHNPWLAYGMRLHRLREAGLLPDIFGSLDERPFTLDQLYEFCNVLFIGDKSGVKLPHPRMESLTSFFQTLKMLVDKEEMQWNPVRKKMMPWIDMARLEAIHCRRSRDNHRSKSVHDPSGDCRRPTIQRPLRHSMSDPPGDYKQQTMPKKYERSHSEPPNVSASTPPCNPLQHFLLTVHQMFPPTNRTVEMHEYFGKWNLFDEGAFDGFSGDELVELLAKATKKAKFFFHPDKLPKDMTENQTQLVRILWDKLCDEESKLIAG